MTPFTLTNSAARRVFLDRHALSETPQGAAHGDDLLTLIKRLGFVQLDSINTVARAHDLILFSRKPRYRPKALKLLYERDRALFEHWTHDAAIIPIAFYPYWHMRRDRDATLLRNRYKDWRRDGFEAQFQPVLDMIAERGPVCSADVGEGEKRGSGGWWDWHPSKTALEYLWRSGALSVVKRQGFQKYYDLTERVIDRTTMGNAPDTEETIDWCCREALSRLGFATHGELAAFWAHITPAEAKAWCTRALTAGRIIQINVTGVDGTARPAYAWPDLPECQMQSVDPTPVCACSAHLIRPCATASVPNVCFGFQYRIEIFVPEPKRTYGYYVFPLLEGDKLVGRIDMKAFRADDTLRVRALWPELACAGARAANAR